MNLYGFYYHHYNILYQGTLTFNKIKAAWDSGYLIDDGYVDDTFGALRVVKRVDRLVVAETRWRYRCNRNSVSNFWQRNYSRVRAKLLFFD